MTPTHRALFVNLPVSDLPASKAFFAALGFSFEPRFTNDDGACMVISDQAFVMLLRPDFFRTFTPRPLGDAKSTASALYALDASSRPSVDAMMEAALAAGATEAREPSDLGFMYSRSFFDLDGHQWEVFHMDEAAFEASAS